MKKLIFAAVIIFFSFTINVEASANVANRVGGYFYASLSPYGTWVDIGYGVIAWKPTIMVRTWQPYYQGRWIWSDYGWYWYSYEPFGHIVYHYGRWYYDDYYGWIWIPDYEWAPAWVEWRYTDSYIGWAPLSPYAVFSISIGISFTRDYYVPYTNWHYVHINNFYSPYLTSYYVAPKYKYRIHSKSKHRMNYGYYNGKIRNDGIDVRFIEKRSGQTIRLRNIETVNDPRQVVYDKNRDINRENLRTFYLDRNELSREALRDVEVSRSDRRTTLDLSRVELGSTRNLDREKIRKEMSEIERRDVRQDENRREINRDDRNIQNERRANDDRKVDIRENRSTERNTNDIRNRNENEIRRNESTQIERNTEQIRRNNDVRINNDNQKLEAPRVIQREEKKPESNVLNNRNNEMRIERKVSTQNTPETKNIERRVENNQKQTRVETQKRTDNSKKEDSETRKKDRNR